MNNHIYIADNPTDDMFDIVPPSFDTGTALPPPPVKEASEMDTFMAKSFTSFGVMAICIVVIIILALFIKKKKNTNEEFTISNINTNEESKQEEEIIETPIVQTKKRKPSKLRTPNTLNKCIKSFLENTKEN